MKINVNSWHFNVMLYYRYVRFVKLGKYSRPDSWNLWHYRTFSSRGEEGSDPFRNSEHITYDQYKRYAVEDNKLPMDFCTYWRGVLLFPLWHVFVWSCLAVYLATLLYMMDWGAVALIGGGVAAIIALVVGLAFLGMFAYERYIIWRETNRPDEKEKEPGFFENLKKSINDHNICTMVEYTDNEKEAAE